MAGDELTIGEMVAGELRRDPSVSLQELHWLASRIDPAVEDLSPEAFAERFLPTEWEEGPPTKPTGRKRFRARARRSSDRTADRRAAPPRKPPVTSRAERSTRHADLRPVAREAFLAFAKELSAAESRREIVDALAGVDHYVDSILRHV